MTTYFTMTPISNNTRLRDGHSTYDDKIASYNAGQLIRGDEVWEAPADGSEVKKGDKWLHVTHVDGVALAENERGWMAYIHKGFPICDNFQEHEDSGSGGGDGGTGETVYVVLPIGVEVKAIADGTAEIYIDRMETPTTIYVKDAFDNFIPVDLPPLE